LKILRFFACAQNDIESTAIIDRRMVLVAALGACPALAGSADSVSAGGVPVGALCERHRGRTLIIDRRYSPPLPFPLDVAEPPSLR
jgi:hypothetical protein